MEGKPPLKPMGFFGFNFGLEGFLGIGMYLAGITAFVLSVLWKPQIGLWFLTPLIPLQTIRDRMAAFPLGGSVVGILLLGVSIGLLRRKKWILPRTPWSIVLGVYCAFTLASLLTDWGNLGVRLSDWKDYMLMPLLLFLTAAAIENRREMQFTLVLMCVAVFLMDRSFWNAIADRDFSTFSRDLQEGGAMGYAGVQGLSAFNAQFAWFMVAMSNGQSGRVARCACVGLALFAAYCVMYSFSRGAYVGFLMGWIFIGVAKLRKLLVLLVLFAASWAAIVPPAVQERVTMTYDETGQMDHAAAVRLELWAEAMDLFNSSPVLGAGFNTYAHMKHIYDYADTHNIYLKVLVETGVVGLAVFLALLGRTFWVGFASFRRLRDPFFSSLSLGLAAWIVCAATSSCFGDRWTYLQINGYLWMIAGFVSRAIDIEQAKDSAAEEVDVEDVATAAACV